MYVRETGLAFGSELLHDRLTRRQAPGEAKRIIGLVRDQGVLIGIEGQFGNILKIRPLVTLTSHQADIAIAAIDIALGQVRHAA